MVLGVTVWLSKSTISVNVVICGKPVVQSGTSLVKLLCVMINRYVISSFKFFRFNLLYFN